MSCIHIVVIKKHCCDKETDSIIRKKEISIINSEIRT